MILALVFVATLATLVAVAVVVLRRPQAAPAAPEPAPAPTPRVLAAAVAPAATISGAVRPPTAPKRSENPLDALDALLAELESTTVRIDGADELDERAVAELEGLAARLEAAAETLAVA
jgi:hypothetical protein